MQFKQSKTFPEMSFCFASLNEFQSQKANEHTNLETNT
jgi:hypothetical protein